MRPGTRYVMASILTRFSVVLLLCGLAMMTHYLNFKVAYNHPRLVELSSGKTARLAYEAADQFFGWFGDAERVAQSNGGMTWSIRVMGVPFTDPVAATSVMVKHQRLQIGFVLGLLVPVAVAMLLGRVFCSYVCPASLLFFTIGRLRGWLGRWLYLPEVSLNRGFAWGILLGGLIVAVWTGHGIWSLILPYFAVGQTIFHGLAMGTLSVTLGSLILFACLDLFLGRHFTCRYVCPTGRLLGFLGRRSAITIRRDPKACLDQCTSCTTVCPLKADPKRDHSVDCSLCGECLVICPTQCLTIGRRSTK